MKKVLSIILMALVVTAVFVSCDQPKHEHSYGKEWRYNGTSHWHECSCGERSEEVAHTYGEWKSSTETGKVERKCTDCEYVETAKGAFVGTKDEFNTAIANDNVKIVLGADIDLANDSNLEINDKKSIEIDLNGKTLTLKKRMYVKGSNLTLSGNGTLKTSTDGDNSVIWLYGSTEKTVTEYTVLNVGEGITLEGQRGISLVSLNDSNTPATGNSYGVVVNLNGTTINASVCGLYINGLVINTENAPVFNVKNVTIKSTGTGATDDYTGIYAAGYGIWNIEDTTINAVDSAMEIRAGELNIKSGKYSSTATPSSCDANGNGTTSKGTAIAVAQHTTKLPIAVNISGGEFSGYHALMVKNPQNNASEACKKVSVTVTGGAFSSTSNQNIVNVDESFAVSENPTYTSHASFSVKAKETV